MTKEKAENYRRLGVNRISLGAQTFKDETLKRLNRRHSAKDILIDIGLAIVVWILWLGIQAGVSRMVPSHAKYVSALLPQNPLEVVLWIATSLSRGILRRGGFPRILSKAV